MTTDVAVQASLDRLEKVGFALLTDVEQTLAAVWLFDAAVSNTGFAGYFSGKRGDLAFHAPTALRAIGATQLAEIAAEANALFGPDGPPTDRQLRRGRMGSFPVSALLAFTALDARYSGCEEDVDELLEAFLARADKAK